MNPNLIFAAVRHTIEDPRAAARWIIAQRFSLTEGLMALVVVGLVTSILSSLVLMIAPDEGFDIRPVPLAAFQVAGLIFGAGLMRMVGLWFGGKGRLEDAMLLLAWVEAIMILLQVVQIVTLFILPPVAILLALFGVGLLIWLTVNFIAELHGFKSLLLVFLGMIGTGVALTILMAVVIAVVLGA